MKPESKENLQFLSLIAFAVLRLVILIVAWWFLYKWLDPKNVLEIPIASLTINDILKWIALALVTVVFILLSLM